MRGRDGQEKERFKLAETVADGGFFEEQFGLTLLQSAVGGEIRCGQVQTWMWYLRIATETDLQGADVVSEMEPWSEWAAANRIMHTK